MTTVGSHQPARVWYASYGSNMFRDRLLAYLAGGRPTGVSRTYPGCTDTTPPTADTALRWPGQLYFARYSSIWGGGVAFADRLPADAGGEVFGRGYLISTRQFCELVHFENGGVRAADAAELALADVVTAGYRTIGSGAYETLWCLGEREGVPIVTFTAPFSTAGTEIGEYGVPEGQGGRAVEPAAPSAAYLRTIARGLREAYGFDVDACVDYLRQCPGADRWSSSGMAAALR